MITRKTCFYLVSLLCLTYNLFLPCSAPQCPPTIKITVDPFFLALERVSHPNFVDDEEAILTHLCANSALPWQIVRGGAHQAQSHPMPIKSNVFTTSQDFATKIHACIKSDGLDTRELEKTVMQAAPKSRKSITLSHMIWGAGGIVVGWVSAYVLLTRGCPALRMCS